MSLRVDDLSTFLAIVRLGSFSAAAEQMHVTQSAVTRRIAELETRLGVKLFDRNGKKATLTTEGRIALDHAQQIVSTAQRMRRALGRPDLQTGVVRIGAGETVALWWLPQFAVRVSRLFPGITLELDVDLSERHIQRFEHGKLDMLFLPGHPPSEGNRLLLDDINFAWMASPRLGIPNRVLEPAELASWPILTLSAESFNHIRIMDWLARAKITPSRVDVCNSLNVVSNMVMAGMGVAMLPLQLFQEAIATNKLQCIETTPALPPIPLWVIYRETSTLPLGGLASIADDVHRYASQRTSTTQ